MNFANESVWCLTNDLMYDVLLVFSFVIQTRCNQLSTVWTSSLHPSINMKFTSPCRGSCDECKAMV
jgi:hypothetical protein